VCCGSLAVSIGPSSPSPIPTPRLSLHILSFDICSLPSWRVFIVVWGPVLPWCPSDFCGKWTRKIHVGRARKAQPTPTLGAHGLSLMLACLAVVARSLPLAPGGQRQPVCQADAFYGEALVSALSARTVETQQWQLCFFAFIWQSLSPAAPPPPPRPTSGTSGGSPRITPGAPVTSANSPILLSSGSALARAGSGGVGAGAGTGAGAGGSSGSGSPLTATTAGTLGSPGARVFPRDMAAFVDSLLQRANGAVAGAVVGSAGRVSAALCLALEAAGIRAPFVWVQDALTAPGDDIVLATTGRAVQECAGTNSAQR
jgi:hypothetical protein